MRPLIFLFLLFCTGTPFSHADQWSAALLTSTESDPDAFIGNYFNAINGDYCEAVTDLIIDGTDPLIIQRFYSSKNYFTGEGDGGWRVFPQNSLIVSKDPVELSEGQHEQLYAFTGERSGSILTYTGSGLQEPLKICMEKHGLGMVNTYAKELNGQTNHQNNRLFYGEKNCELILGDGTKRLYQRMESLPSLVFGEEIYSLIANKLSQPQYFRLVSETLPSGNVIEFTYESNGHLAAVEMKNESRKKTYLGSIFVMI